MPETPLQSLLKRMGQQQPNFLPQQPQVSAAEEARQRFMQMLGQRQPPRPEPPQARPLPGGLPMPPSSREHGRQQMQGLQEQAAQQVLGPTTGIPGYPGPQARQLAAQGPTMGPPRPLSFLDKPGQIVREAYGAMFEPDEYGNVGGDVAMGPLGALGKSEAKQLTRTFRDLITDRYAWLRDYSTIAKLPAKDDFYVGARLFAGYGGKIQNKLDEMEEILKPFQLGLDPRKWSEQRMLQSKFKEYITVERMREQAKFGIEKFPVGMSSLDLIERSRTMAATLPPERLKQFKQAHEELTRLSNDVLANAKDSGLVADELFKDLTVKHKKYIPLHVVGGKLEAMESAGIGGTLQVSKPDVLHAMTGSTSGVADPIESIIRNVYRITNQAERNRVARQVVAMAKHPDKQVSELMRPLEKADQLIPEGWGKITAWENGEQKFWMAPEPIADTIKGMGKKDADLFTRWASKSTAVLRAGATSLNAAFIPSNAVRDFQTAKLVSRGMGEKFTIADWVGGFASAIKKDEAYRGWLENGGSFSGYYLHHQPMRRTSGPLFHGKSLQAAKTLTNPFQAIEWLGQAIESAPRLGLYKRLSGKGLTEAAFNSRDLTVDFAKSGNLLKLVNLWVPFLNARLQGTMNIGHALFNSKDPAAAWATAAGWIGIPAALTYLNNTQRFPHIWADIQQFEKDNYFLAIYGDGIDARGNPTDVFKIPKGDAGKAIGGPLENFLRYLDGRNPQAMKALFLDIASDISPVPFAREGELSGTAILSAITPPTLKAGLETSLGKNMFTGRNIEPIGWTLDGRSAKEMYYEPKYALDEQGNRTMVDPGTPEWAVKFSEVLDEYNIKLSPLRILNAVGTQFGGLGRQLADPEMAPRMITGRFHGARGGEIMRRDIERAKDIATDYADIEARLSRKDEQNWLDFRDQRMSQEKRTQALQELVSNGGFSGLLRRALMEHKTAYERYLLRQDAKTRAAIVSDYMERMPPEAAGYLDSKWTALGILNMDTRMELSKITQQKAQKGVQ